MFLAISPSPALDRTLLVDELVVGRVHRPIEVLELAGGKGLNVARAAHRLGADVTALAVLGGHSGAVVREMLEAEGIRADVISGDVPTRICTTVVCQRTGVSTDFYEATPLVPSATWATLTSRAEELLAAGLAWVTVSGSMPRNLGVDEVAHLVALAHKSGARVALDTHGEALRSALQQGPDVVKVNVHEAAELVAPGSRDPLLCARLLHERRDRGWLTIVTAGKHGAFAVTNQHTWSVTPPRLGRFPIGSGDSFLAGLVVGMERGTSVPQALALASAAAAANTQVPGAAILDASLARSWASNVVVDELAV